MGRVRCRIARSKTRRGVGRRSAARRSLWRFRRSNRFWKARRGILLIMFDRLRARYVGRDNWPNVTASIASSQFYAGTRNSPSHVDVIYTFWLDGHIYEGEFQAPADSDYDPGAGRKTIRSRCYIAHLIRISASIRILTSFISTDCRRSSPSPGWSLRY